VACRPAAGASAAVAAVRGCASAGAGAGAAVLGCASAAGAAGHGPGGGVSGRAPAAAAEIGGGIVLPTAAGARARECVTSGASGPRAEAAA
jgi:hypothetical protein